MLDSVDTRRSPKPGYRFEGVLPTALNLLRDRAQWLSWDFIWSDRAKKWAKPPCDARTGKVCGATKPEHWGSFEEARATAQRCGMAGIGFALAPDDNITGGDIDDCVDPKTGKLSPIAEEIIGFGETYAEISPSGTGIRFFALGKIEKAVKDDGVGVELYGAGRYLTVTGKQVPGSPGEVREAHRTVARLTEIAHAARDARNDAKRKVAQPPADRETGFFKQVNTEALVHLDDWVPGLLPRARKEATGAWRVSSNDLGRPLEEDLSIHPEGIQDFGTEESKTPIDIIMEHGDAQDSVQSALWLCGQMGINPKSLGWKGNSSGYSGNSSSKRRYGHNSGASDPIRDDPIPLFRQLNSGAEFPVNALGPIIGPTVKALHESAVQAPIAMCAASALAAAAISTQAQANIALPHGEVVPLSLYLLVIAESGERKSSLHKRILDGVGRYTKELEATYKEEIFTNRVERAAWEAEKRLIANDKKLSYQERKEKLQKLGAEPTPPKGPFLMVKEPTMQGLDKVMIAGQHSVGLFTSEAGEFLGGHAMGKERITGTLARLNSLWDGDGIERIRAGEEPVICRDRRMSLFFQIQPHLSTQTLTNPIVRDIGFLSRLLICRPESAIGTRFGSEPTNEQTRALLEFSTRSFQLMKKPLPLSDDGILEPPELTISSDAAKALTLFNHFIEKEMAEGGSYEAIRGFASKLGQHAARLAGVILLFEAPDADEIGVEHLQRGIDIALYYASEALRLQGIAQVNEELVEAQNLLEWLSSKWGTDVISVTEIIQYGPNAIRDANKVRELLEILESNGHLASASGVEVRQPNGGVMRRRQAWRVVGQDKKRRAS